MEGIALEPPTPGGGGGESELLVPKLGMLTPLHAPNMRPAARTASVTTFGDFGS